MAGHVVSKITPNQGLEILGITMADIVSQTGLGDQSVSRAFMGGKVRTNTKTAQLIADAMGIPMDQLEWPSGLTHVGRPPLTGGSYTVGAGTSSGSGGDGEFEYPDEGATGSSKPLASERLTGRRMRVQTEYCTDPEHNLLLPLSGICDVCAA